METSELFFPDMAVRVEQVSTDERCELIVQVRATCSLGICPDCRQPSSCIHSRYVRHPADLPWVGKSARLLLQVRTFFCTNTNCTRRIFTERLPKLVQPYARRTLRLAHPQRQIGLAVGGRAGSRLAQDIGMPTGRDTLLTLVRRMTLPAQVTPRVVGIDDWALRRGQTYGTICVDLETRRPIDLLPERSVERVSQWFGERPGIEIVSRDRAAWYAEAVRKGAPSAVQVVDRWHLLKNLGELALRVLQQHHAAVRRVVDAPYARIPTVPQSALPLLTPDVVVLPAASVGQAVTIAKRAARLARFADVHTLHEQGWSLHAIAAHTRLDRKTARNYLRLAELPDAQPRGVRSSKLDAYKPYIVERWNGGCRNGAHLLREITARGYNGQRSLVKTYITALRKQQGLAPRSRGMVSGQVTLVVPKRRPSLQTLAWLMVREPHTLDAAGQDMLVQLQQAHPDVGQIVALVQQFAALVRQRQVDRLDNWLVAAGASSISAVDGFVASLRSDLAGVRAALTLPWSNGPVEGHVNRLKLLKRQSYGRANFDLLRLRVLAAP